MDKLNSIKIVKEFITINKSILDSSIYDKVNNLLDELSKEKKKTIFMSDAEVKTLNNKIIEDFCNKNQIKYRHMDLRNKNQIRIEEKMDIYTKSRKYHIFPDKRGVIEGEKITDFISDFLKSELNS